MADQIEVTSLAAQAASSIDSDTQVVAFTQAGDTTRLPLVEAVAYANQVNECICIHEASLTIASADVLTLNTTPIEIIPAQGAGTAIQVINSVLSMTFNSVAYATNTSLRLTSTTSTTEQASSELSQTSDAFSSFEIQDGNASVIQYADNAALNLTVEAGNPTAGDSDITVYVTYRVITL